MCFEIRAAMPEDAHQCARIHICSWDFAYKDYVPLDIIKEHNARRPAMWKKLLAENQDVHYIITLDHQAIGIITINPQNESDLPDTVYELSGLYFDPDFVGKGLGTRAMNWIKTEIKTRGFHGISLWVLSQNDRAKAFYIKNGFHPDGRQKESGIGTAQKERFIYIFGDIL